MSKLEELIARLCPDGVEYKSLTELCDVLYGYPCDASKFNEVGTGLPLIRIRDVLEGVTKTFTDEKVPECYIVKKGDLLVGMDGNFHVGNWKGEIAILCQRVCRISSKDENILVNGFLSHIIGPIMLNIENSKKSGTVKHLLAKDIRSIKVPVPPLEVQREIVHILDSYTASNNELKEQLEKELAARQKQYEWYKDNLLNDYSMYDIIGNENKLEIEYKKICEISSFRRGSFPQPYGNKEWYDGYGAMPFVQVADIGDDLRLVNNTKRKISVLAQPKSVFAPKGSIIISLQGSIGRIAVTQYDAYIDRTVAIFKDLDSCIIPKYFVYQLQKVFAFKEKTARGSTIKTITKEEFMNFVLPVPPLNMQQRIVDILDRFDALCNDITSGLPAEIEARKKQYEYYRDKLLTFKELKKEA
ncbi:MAG: restriction endonuclease subunit S [Phascolarctobacterium sp.]|nr:restriction endonuclease subunit S [Phascolarctobacterium sp.]